MSKNRVQSVGDGKDNMHFISGVYIHPKACRDQWRRAVGGCSLSNLVRRAEETASGVGVWLRSQGPAPEIPLPKLKEAHTSLKLGWNWILLLFSLLLVWGYILQMAIQKSKISQLQGINKNILILIITSQVKILTLSFCKEYFASRQRNK